MDFYLIKLKRLKHAKNIAEKIKFLLNNSYFNSLFKKYLFAAIDNNDAEIEYSSDQEIIIRKKSVDVLFHLTINSDMNFTIKVNNSIENVKIEIAFYQEENRIDFTKEVTTPNLTRSLSQKKIERKIYIDDMLRYEYNYCSLEDLPPLKDQYITVTDIYIDLDNNAVCQKMLLSGSKGKTKNMELEYFETNSYPSLSFNNLTNYNYDKLREDMIPSTKEHFYDVVMGSNNISPTL